MENKIKLRIPASVYIEFYDRFMRDYSDTADLESKLDKAMAIYNDAGLTQEAIAIIRKKEATDIARRCKEGLIPKKEAIERIEAGKATLGYTTELQEIAARRELVERFEFTAICLAVFKRKYGII